MPVLHAARFKRLIHRHGKTVAWSKAYLNSNYNPATNDSDITTSAVSGIVKGRYYVPQTLGADVRAGVVFLQRRWLETQAGSIFIGDAKVVVMPSDFPPVGLGKFDRLTLLQHLEEFQEVVRFGNDTLSHTPVVAVQAVRQNATLYVAGDDYELVDGAIEWQDGGNAPEEDSNYVVSYTFHPTYYFSADQHSPAFTDAAGVLLPQQGTLTFEPPQD